MKILVLGDIHGRTCWKDIIKNETFDKVVFLGDYVSSHDHVFDQDQINNLEEILKYKEENSDKVILLRGNHDLQHLNYYWASCSGYFKNVALWLNNNSYRFIHDTQWIYIVGNIIFSHAGISTKWMEFSNIKNIEDINDFPPSEIFGFTSCFINDYYGTSPTQPPTWIRPQTLINYMPEGYTQVVGHTPTSSHKILKLDDSEKRNTLWLCDTLPYEYLLIDNDKFITKNVNIV